MRVCLVGPVWPYRGGISHNSAIIVNGLNNLGHKVLMISFRRQYPLWLYPGQTDRDNSNNPLKVPAIYILDSLSPISWFKAAKMIVTFKPDIVAVQWWTVFWSIPFTLIANYICAHKVHLTFLIHNVIPHESKPWDKLLARLPLNKARDFLVFSELEKQKLLKLIPGRHIVVSSLPIYSFDVGENPTKVIARKQLDLPEDAKIFLFFGFVRPYKGLHVLLEALGTLKNKCITPYLVIVGEFWNDKQSYIDSIHRLDIQDHIRIEDRYVPNEEAALWFKATDCLIAPYVEGVTQSAVASLAYGFGVPMIVTTQVFQGLGNVDISKILVVPPNDVLALKEAMEDFLLNPSADENVAAPDSRGARKLVEDLLGLANNLPV